MTTFRVYGTPAPQGSKRHVGNGVMVESSAKVKPWRQDVRAAALMAGGDRLEGPVGLRVVFLLRRPKSHFRTGKNAHLLRDGAPTQPATKPDIDKLLRSTLDGLGESDIWRDDAQVVDVSASKLYADDEPTGAVITIQRLGDK